MVKTIYTFRDKRGKRDESLKSLDYLPDLHQVYLDEGRIREAERLESYVRNHSYRQTASKYADGLALQKEREFEQAYMCYSCVGYKNSNAYLQE